MWFWVRKKEVKSNAVDGASTSRQQRPSCRTMPHHRLFFATLKTSVLGCLRFFSSLLGQTRCCEVKREFPEERSFIGENHTVSACRAIHRQEGWKRRHRKARSRCSDRSKCGQKKMKHSLFLIRVVGWALEPMSMELSKAQYTLDGSPGSAGCAGHLLTDRVWIEKGYLVKTCKYLDICGLRQPLHCSATSPSAIFPPLSLKITQSLCFFSETVHQDRGTYDPGNDLMVPGQVRKM